MDDMHTFLVRGPASRFPRGYLWLVPIWFAILGVVVIFVSRELSGQFPLWLGIAELGGLVLAGLVLLGALATVRRHAFRVSEHGIWLGVRTTRKRPKLRQVHISWADIAQVRMVQRPYGTLLEITLGPAARIMPVLSVGRQALLLLGVLIMPIGFGRGRPGLTAPRIVPPRYVIKLCEVTPDEVRQVFTQLKPQDLGVRVLAKPGALRFGPMPRQRSLPQPERAPVPR